MHALLALPEGAQRLLAGRTVTLDGQRLATETQLMLRLSKLAGPAIETLPIPRGRVVLDEQCAAGGRRPPVGQVRDLEVAGLPARLYTPTSELGSSSTPLLVFLHGGGFMYGGLLSHDAPCRFLAERAGVKVLSVGYRLAPEHPFPAAYDDAVAAYRWTVANAASLGADPARLAVGGDSAGGNLAAGVAVAAAREGLPLALQLLIYPATDNTRANRSLELFGDGFYLTEAFIARATESYLPDPAERTDPRASPTFEPVPEGLAPAFVATAGFDPLRDEGEAFAWRLSDAGVRVELKRFPNQIHGFLNTVGVGRRARAAVGEIAEGLRAGLA